MFKILTSGAIALSIGLSMLGFGRNDANPPTDASALDCLPACMEDCDATVERLPDGTCRVDRVDANGEACWAIVTCTPDGACEVLESSANCELADCSAGGFEEVAGEAESSNECGAGAVRPSCATSACDAAATN